MNAVASPAGLSLRQLERILAVVERYLRKAVPGNFHKRCAYAAFGVREMLREVDAAPEVIGGDFAAFIIARDDSRASMAGLAYGQEQCSHFWVECDRWIIDLGPSFLPLKATYPAARMPAAVWNLSEPLPAVDRRGKGTPLAG